MRTSFAAAGLGALIAIASIANAQAEERWPRWYLGLSGGYNYMSDQDISGSATINKVSLDNGYSYGASIGYLPSSSAPLLNALRLEAEVTRHYAAVNRTKGSGGGAGNGYYATTAYMANVFYDFVNGGQWTPYIGAGVGLADVHLSTNSGVGNTDASSSEFAYQALLGVGYSPTSLPNTQWLVGYRYLATTDASFSGINASYSSHSLEAGAHFRF